MSKRKKTKKPISQLSEARKLAIERLRAFQFKPGQSGNPSGLPKEKPITLKYKQALNLPLPAHLRRRMRLPKGSTIGDCIALQMVLKAAAGNVAAAVEVTDRIEGKPMAGNQVSDANTRAPSFHHVEFNFVQPQEREQSNLLEGEITNGN